MVVFKTISFYLAIFGILITIIFSNIVQTPSQSTPHVQEPSENPFSNTISASGIVESVDKNIEIGTPEEGVVEKLWVKVGDQVQKGDPLFRIDARNLEAELIVERAKIEVSRATMERLKDKLKLLKAVDDPRAISIDEIQTRDHDVLVAQKELEAAEASMMQTQKQLERFTVKAPKDGQIIQENVREGEYISNRTPLIVLGDVNHLQIRVSIDEQNAGKFNKNSQAVAYPKNNTTEKIPLTFVRVEPFVIPKKSLTGSSEERVDTRVLQVIYSFTPPQNYHMYVGQQADVYIDNSQQAIHNEK